ncbi:MAG TPA: hypothetical protein PLY88_05240 [Candidatus Omnitrophota bacterium]|nr:hypothetical protein [Candidatus Omnitrophota bacterium]
MSFNFYLGILLLIFGLMKTGLFIFGKNLTLARLVALKNRFGSRKGTAIY